MEHTLPNLPYAQDALVPHMSAETMQYHYGKHHQAYVNKLNELIKGTQFESMDLDQIVKTSEGGIFNNAAQHWNHSFFWKCLTPKASPIPGGKISDLINKQWGTCDKFKEEFNKAAIGNFGSGWTWLVKNDKGNLEIMSTSNADTPLKHGLKALLTVDVWEHAYYIDYRNSRPNFMNAFWNIVNWDFVNENL